MSFCRCNMRIEDLTSDKQKQAAELVISMTEDERDELYYTMHNYYAVAERATKEALDKFNAAYAELVKICKISGYKMFIGVDSDCFELDYENAIMQEDGKMIILQTDERYCED